MIEQTNIHDYLDEAEYELEARLTSKEALRILRQYRKLNQGFTGYDTKVTATYSLMPRTFSNQFHSSVEDKVLKKLEYLEWVEHGVNKMSNAYEKQVIVEGYLGKEKHNWIKMSEMFHLNKTDYYILRNKALLSFAIALHKEVYKITEKERKIS